MKLLFFKLIQTTSIVIGWAFLSIIAMICAPVFLAWSSGAMLGNVWAYKPKAS